MTKHSADTLASVQWKPLRRGATVTAATIDPGTASAFSPEGYRLYLTAEVGVVVVDTVSLALKAQLVPDRAVR